MTEHQATIRWERAGAEFSGGRYSREHTWTFDGGLTIAASPSPHVVPAPYSNPALVDPEEAYVAAIESFHMLTFLWLASREGWVVDRYEDQAVGSMRSNERGVPWVATVRLRPRVGYGGGARPGVEDEARLHHAAHDQCFIANSVKTQIDVQPTGSDLKI